MSDLQSDFDKSLIDAFVRRHFSLRGSLGLHRHAFGLDLLRAPSNVLLSLVFLLSRILAAGLHLVGFRRAGHTIAAQRILFRMSVGRALEASLRESLIKWSGCGHLTERQARLISDYISVRTAVAEIVTTALIAVLGLAVFRVVTPGVLTLAPIISETAARTRAVETFPLGSRLGNVWYSAFPVDAAPLAILGFSVGLLLCASFVTTFAGVIADPIQAGLGIHQRRLGRLLYDIDGPEDAAPRLAGEHFVARVADIVDAGVSVMRLFRP